MQFSNWNKTVNTVALSEPDFNASESFFHDWYTQCLLRQDDHRLLQWSTRDLCLSFGIYHSKLLIIVINKDYYVLKLKQNAFVMALPYRILLDLRQEILIHNAEHLLLTVQKTLQLFQFEIHKILLLIFPKTERQPLKTQNQKKIKETMHC